MATKGPAKHACVGYLTNCSKLSLSDSGLASDTDAMEPFQLLFGRLPARPVEIVKELKPDFVILSVGCPT